MEEKRGKERLIMYYPEFLSGDMFDDGPATAYWNWVWIEDGALVGRSVKSYSSEEELLETLRGFLNDEHLNMVKGIKPDFS